MNIFQTKKSPQNKIISQFRAIKSIEDVADILNIDLNELLEIVEVDYKLQYKFFKIPKKDGSFRDLASPESNLKEIQRRLAYILEILYETNKREGINGFLKNRNIVKNAETHKKQEIIINIDIEDFFPSITFTRVRGIFLGYYRFNIEISQFISRICCFPPEQI
jgi:RNA-directed DNA polymerase